MWGFNKLYLIALIVQDFIAQSFAAFFATYFMRYLIQAIQDKQDFFSITAFVVGVFLVGVLLNAFDWGLNFWYQEIVSAKFRRYYDKMLFKKAGNVELSCYEGPIFYNKYTMALDNSSNRILQVNSNAIGAVFSLYRVVVLLAAMIAIDPPVVLFLIFPIIGNFVFGRMLNNADQKVYKENTKNNRIIAYVMRALHLQQYSKEMRQTNIFSLIQKKHHTAVSDYCGVYDKHYAKRGLLFWNKNLFIYTLIYEGVLFYCCYRAIVHHSISLAEMTIMTSVMVSVTQAIIDFFNQLMNIHSQGLYIQNARDFIDYEPKIPEDYQGAPAPDKIQSIEFRDVCFGYQPDEYTIKNVSFKINGGEMVAFVGENGAGKTTLVKLLFRLYDPSEGEILLNGKNIKDYNLKSYRSLFAAAFQDYRVIAASVKDNITMGEDIQNAEQVAVAALKKVGLYEKVCSFKNGIDTIMTKEFDDEGEVLSGGQYQKLAVARAIARSCPAYVFDEPSSALDPIAERELFETIMKESENKTMVFISHRLSSVKKATKVLMLENGELTEQGTHEQLLAKGGSYAFMYNHQAENYLAEEVVDNG